ncbi:hypothetical protein PUN28_004683 [Cardiocondyla obscurior]|uniref:Uncharacterized protein n=1 Tax=Cardiocondyla obscurior TaxID=286306 RepID=A0AAW2GG28_9HYME
MTVARVSLSSRHPRCRSSRDTRPCTRCRCRSFGAGVRWAWNAEGLLWLRLIRSLFALHAFVQSAVEEGSGLADRKRAFLDRCRAHIRGRSAERTGLAGCLHSLSSVRTSRAGFAFSFDGQLLSGSALVATFFPRYRLGCSCGLSETAQ